MWSAPSDGSVIAAVGLARSGAYDSAEMFRRGFFTLLCALTTRGFATLPSRTLVTHRGALAMVVVAMGMGAMSGSTGAGIKAIRIGLLAKALRLETRRILSPPSAALIETCHVGKQHVLRPPVMQSAALIVGCT